METLRLKNIRSIVDTGVIEIKPITLLLGQNSSGKSTFLRSIPLLKQSVNTRKNSPILWYGDLVDFGSIDDAVSNFSEDAPISIDMMLDLDSILSFFPKFYRNIVPASVKRISFGLDVVGIKNKTVLSGFRIFMNKDELELKVDVEGKIKSVLVNQRDLTRHFVLEKIRISTEDIVPQVYFFDGNNELDVRGNAGFIFRSESFVRRMIVNFLSQRLHGRMSTGSINKLSQQLKYTDIDEFPNVIKGVHSSLVSWQNFVSDITNPNSKENLEQLRCYYFLHACFFMLPALYRTVNNELAGISYIGPMRATGERYYRNQELDVGRIDPQGKNLPMFLHSLSEAKITSFSDWLERAIGYYIKIERSPGHIQIKLRSANSDHFHNIADMGYGFSQILPVLAQIWMENNNIKPKIRENIVETSLIVIEQPELHLHPAYQAKLAEILVANVEAKSSLNIVEKNAKNIRYIVETHSEALINKLGDLVYKRKVAPDSIAIYIFDRKNGGPTNIRKASYLPDGTLDNWPIGFFGADL